MKNTSKERRDRTKGHDFPQEVTYRTGTKK